MSEGLGIRIPVDDSSGAAGLGEEPPWRSRLFHVARKQPMGTLGFLLIVALLTSALFGPDLRIGGRTIVPGFSPLPAQQTDIINVLDGPSWSHPSGTDTLGRDVLSRVIHGARPAVVIGVVATVLGITLGTVIGLVSGYGAGHRFRVSVGGRIWTLPEVDMVIQRLMETVMAIPPLIFVMVILVVVGVSTWSIIIVFAIFLGPNSQRVIRGSVLAVREQPYVDAARSVGASAPRLMFRHILPNVAAPVIVLSTVTIGGVILTEAALSFLGLGSSTDKAPTWGVMLNEAVQRGNIDRFPWLAIAPGAAITLTVLAFNLLGDALRDLLDPRLRGV